MGRACVEGSQILQFLFYRIFGSRILIIHTGKHISRRFQKAGPMRILESPTVTAGKSLPKIFLGYRHHICDSDITVN